MSGARDDEPDPDALLAALRDAAGEPPLTPLTLAESPPSARRGPSGLVVGTARHATLRLLSPVLADLLSQLERDRHRLQAEVARLQERIERLERAAATPPE